MRAKRRLRFQRNVATLAFLSITPGAWLVVNGCGSDSFTSGASDASTSDAISNGDGSTPPTDAGGDTYVAAADAGVCDLTASFNTPISLALLNMPNEVDQTARLTRDELVIHYQAGVDAGKMTLSDGGMIQLDGGPLQIYSSTRTNITDDFASRARLPTVVNGMGSASDPSITADNLTLYFTSNPLVEAGTSNEIWIATRSTATVDFSSAANVTLNGNFTGATQPYVLGDGLTMYFRAVSTTTSMNTLYRATRSATTQFTVDPSNALDAVNAIPGVSLPIVTADELTLYFTSGTSGVRKVSKATRTDKSQQFGNIVDVTELNVSTINEGSWISDDGCRLYLSSNVGGTTHLYLAKKPPKN
jgi:hypothetical protein